MRDTTGTAPAGLTPTSSLAEFRAFIERIPDDRWTTGVFWTVDGNGHRCFCILGHLGCRALRETAPSSALARRLAHVLGVELHELAEANDGWGSLARGATPKARVLNLCDVAAERAARAAEPPGAPLEPGDVPLRKGRRR